MQANIILFNFPFLAMKSRMFSDIYYFKIFYPVIKLISIYVVNMLLSFKFSIKMLFHYISMLKESFPFNRNNSVTIKSYTASKVTRSSRFLVRISILSIFKIMMGTKSICSSYFFAIFNQAIGVSNKTFSTTKLRINSFMSKWFRTFQANMFIFHSNLHSILIVQYCQSI